VLPGFPHNSLGKVARSRNWINIAPPRTYLAFVEPKRFISQYNNINPRNHVENMENDGITTANGAGKALKQSKRMLWTHPDPDSTRIIEFMRGVNRKYGLKVKTYNELYQWSINNIAVFWGEVWDFTGITAEKHYDEVGQISLSRDKSPLSILAYMLTPLSQVLPKSAPLFPRPEFFAGSRLNFAENLLYPANLTVDENSPAIIEATESEHSTISWLELRERVRKCALALHFHGVVESDRVAGFLGNHANAVVAMLATASLGAIWTGVSPDTGVTAVLERLVQIEPRVLFVDNAVRYNGKVHGSYEKVKEILVGLEGLEACVMFETVGRFEMMVEGLDVADGKTWTYEEFVKRYLMPSCCVIT
jgi:acetoacetyl-CoA synthetase